MIIQSLKLVISNAHVRESDANGLEISLGGNMRCKLKVNKIETVFR